jgi:hypothetical protein
MLFWFSHNHRLPQQSTDTTLEWVERSIAGIIDQVDALEIVVPPMEQGKLSNDRREDVYDKEEVEDEEPLNPPCPPPRRQHRDDQQGN